MQGNGSLLHHLDTHNIDARKNAKATSEAATAVLNNWIMSAKATREDILFKITLWLAHSFRPFTTVEDSDFRELIEMVKPGFGDKLPKKDRVRAIAVKLAMVIKAQVTISTMSIQTLVL